MSEQRMIYVNEGGWAHSAAHAADALTELVQCPECDAEGRLRPGEQQKHGALPLLQKKAGMQEWSCACACCRRITIELVCLHRPIRAVFFDREAADPVSRSRITLTKQY
ncbi:DUF2785 domain-containing protein [Paenibacillus thiaminolyticus]|uniref:DUF2785 domain-containing protein n=1 Tax=Paenibacillus thiaminolyticus TaxID=49283 RepID=UPI00217574EA|nr:DUF2785 domain-containing protein [Paenibacillus thiaminolyticus]